MKHFLFGAKQGFFKDANSALVCTQQRNEMGACEDLFLVNIPFIIFTCNTWWYINQVAASKLSDSI